MALSKDRHAGISYRTQPKESTRTAAVNEHRSIANMIAVMIRDFNLIGRSRVDIQKSEPPAAAARVVLVPFTEKH